MKAVRVLILLWFVLSESIFSPSAQAALAHFNIAGRSYVRLDDWARGNGYEMRWGKASNAFVLSNRWGQMVFPKDSREANLGGINVCLSYPVVYRDGAAYISQVDLDTAFGPLLYTPKNRAGSKIKNIVIDPGHGGKDPGNIVGAQQEKKYTLLLAQELRDQLKAAGFNVSLTRVSDVFIPLPDRPNIARQRNADLLISVHWNELPHNPSMKGAQIFCLTPGGASSSNAGLGAGAPSSIGNRNNDKNLYLAYTLQKSLLRNLGVEDRGVRRARFWVLRDATMPAVLIEGGFMSNPTESRHIYDAGYRRQMARAITEGVLAYKKQVE